MKLVAIFLICISNIAFAAPAESCPEALDHYKRPLARDKKVHLCEAFKGKVVLIVNTASKCTFTSQYEGLEKLYAKYKNKGLIVAGFPSNDFSGQEPGTEKQIQKFCRLTYGVQFPMFEKTHVRGNSAEPLYRYLSKVTSDAPKWNFHKYLLNRKGEVIGSFASHVRPDSPQLVNVIEQLL